MRWCASTAASVLGSLVSLVILAAPAAAAPRAKAARHSRSVGAPNHGRLVDGVKVTPKKYLRVLPAYAAGQPQWGTQELVAAIDYAAREVRKRYADAVLGVGHLSLPGGGEIDRHASHESGRDVDLAFYLTDAHGRPGYRDGLVQVGVDGKVVIDRGLSFDDGRNWALLRALIENPHAKVTHIFVVGYLRTRILAYGVKIGAPVALRTRMAEVMMQPQHALLHDDHFHVRIACPAGSTECIEYPLAERGGPAHPRIARAPNAPSTRRGPHGTSAPVRDWAPSIGPLRLQGMQRTEGLIPPRATPFDHAEPELPLELRASSPT